MTIGEDIKGLECSDVAGGNEEMAQPLRKTTGSFLKKLNILLPITPLPNEMKMYLLKRKENVCIQRLLQK